MRLSDASIVIIGGTGGIGLSAAEACLREGAHVVAVGRDNPHADEAAAALSAAQSGDAAFEIFRGDASDSQTSVDAVALAVERFGHLSGLYHVAGGSGRRFGDGPLDELTDEGVRWTLQNNLESVLFSNRAAVAQFQRQQTGGSVVNLSSVLAAHPAREFFSTVTYAAAKAGIIGATRSAAARYAPESIRFNVIAPGLVDTPMATRAVGDDAIVTFARNKQPLDGGRVGEPSDTDGAAVFLLSDESLFVTGQTIQVDGGWSVN